MSCVLEFENREWELLAFTKLVVDLYGKQLDEDGYGCEAAGLQRMRDLLLGKLRDTHEEARREIYGLREELGQIADPRTKPKRKKTA